MIKIIQKIFFNLRNSFIFVEQNQKTMTKITLNPWPYDGNPDYEIWRLNVLDSMTFKFMSKNHAFLIEKHGVYDYWLTKLFDRGRDIKQAAGIICRAYKLYKQSSLFFN